MSSVNEMVDVYEDALELEKLIRDCEFENQQYVKLIEKEKQHGEELEREIELKHDDTQRFQESVAQLDNDTKQYHKQFTINRDNCENLKKTSQILTEHIAAVTNNLELDRLKRQQEGDEHSRILEHYRKTWERYKARYESWPVVKKHHEQQGKEQAARAKMEEIKAMLDDAISKVEVLKSLKKAGDFTSSIIKVAESYCRRQQTLKKIEQRNIEMKRLQTMEEEREREEIEAVAMETINNKLKDHHIEDDLDKMETNQVLTDENDDSASPMISVFSGRSYAEEDMQTGEHQGISRTEQGADHEGQNIQDLEMGRKPQSWLESYQEQTQKQLDKPLEPVPDSQGHHLAPTQQKTPVQMSIPQAPQLPFVAFHNAGQQQSSEDMEATVSIHLPERSEESFDVSNGQPDLTPTKSKPGSSLLPMSSQSSSHHNVVGFTNPAFQTSPISPKFTVPIMQTRPTEHVSPHIPTSQRPSVMPQLPLTSPTFQAPLVPIQVPFTSVLSSRLPAASQPQQKPTFSSVQSQHLRMPHNMLNMPQRPQHARPPQNMQITSLRTSISQSAIPIAGAPVQSTIRPSVSSMDQVQTITMPITVGHAPKMAIKPSQQSGPQLQANKVVHQTRAPSSIPSSTPSFTTVPASQSLNGMMQKMSHISAHIQSHSLQTVQIPKSSYASPAFGSMASQAQMNPLRVPSPVKSPTLGPGEKLQPHPQQGLPLRSEAQSRGQGFEGLQKMTEQQSDVRMSTANPRTPQSSPVPMHTSPCISSVDSDQLLASTPDHPKPTAAKTDSPFNMEKHKERIKHINKSPGDNLFKAGRRMFEGSKGESGDNDRSALYSQIFDKSSTFSLFAGGDGLLFPTPNKPAQEKSSPMKSSASTASQATALDSKINSNLSESFNGQGTQDFLNFDLFNFGSNDKKKSSEFEDFGQDIMKSQFTFDMDPVGNNLKSLFSNESDRVDSAELKEDAFSLNF